MKGNYENLTALAARIEAVESSKEDYLVHTSAMEMDDDEHLVVKPNGNAETFRVNDVAHGQIAARLEIPKSYYDRMTAVPGLRAYTVNKWLGTQDEKRMVRTLEGTARAYLSDSFKPYDNYDVLSAMLPVLQAQPGLEVRATALTDKRMYIQFLFRNLTAEVKPGVKVGAGLTIANSEVGWGAIDVKAFILNYVCSNGAVAESLLRKYHVGRKVDDADYGIFKSDTVEADIQAFKLKLRDIVGVALDAARWEKRVAQMRGAAEDQIKDPVVLIEKVTRRFGLTEGEGVKTMYNLVRGGDVTRWGLSNAITALANEIESPDRQYEIEQAGWDVIKITPSEWEVLSN
ncbi:MAG: DUF932 domain-containing protein [Chloroflexi bacterium]|nr:DUF932 domain-containing protein [Chloroflexota bacterium]